MESFSSIVEELLASVSDDLSESWSTSPLLLVLGTIGGLAVASTVFSFLRLVASLAVLPGKSVRYCIYFALYLQLLVHLEVIETENHQSCLDRSICIDLS